METLKADIKRERAPDSSVLMLIGGKEEQVDRAQLYENLEIDGLIRIPESEYGSIDTDSGLFGHFNLEKTNHKVGGRYLLVKIVRNGTYGSETKMEEPPLLSLDGACLAECLRVENNISYDDIQAEYFEHSIKGVTDDKSLKKVIVRRYGSSREDLSEDEIVSKGVAYTLLKVIGRVNESLPTFTISVDQGYVELQTEGVSSKVFVKDGKIFKLNNRNSFERQKSDLDALRSNLAEYQDHIPNSEVVECEYDGGMYTCVIQPVIEGDVFKGLEKTKLDEALKIEGNRKFLLKLLEYFFKAVESQKLYPDPVGYPVDPEYFNSINLILERSTNIIKLCDVGLSPHEDTLARHGASFFDGENVKTYLTKMKAFEAHLLSL